MELLGAEMAAVVELVGVVGMEAPGLLEARGAVVEEMAVGLEMVPKEIGFPPEVQTGAEGGMAEDWAEPQEVE